MYSIKSAIERMTFRLSCPVRFISEGYRLDYAHFRMNEWMHEWADASPIYESNNVSILNTILTKNRNWLGALQACSFSAETDPHASQVESVPGVCHTWYAKLFGFHPYFMHVLHLHCWDSIPVIRYSTGEPINYVISWPVRFWCNAVTAVVIRTKWFNFQIPMRANEYKATHTRSQDGTVF